MRPGPRERGCGSFRLGTGRRQGGRSLGGELPGEHLTGRPTPRAASRKGGRCSRKDPPPSSAAAPLHRLYFLLLPGPVSLPIAAAASSRASLAAKVAVSRSRSPGVPPVSCRPLVAAPRVRARPGGGRCWEARAGTVPTARQLPDLSVGPSAPPPPTRPPTKKT